MASIVSSKNTSKMCQGNENVSMPTVILEYSIVWIYTIFEYTNIFEDLGI